MCLLKCSPHRPDEGCHSAQQSSKVFGFVPGGDSSLSGSIGDTDATIHVGRPPQQDIEHMPRNLQSTQARWRLKQRSSITQGVWIGPWW
jgi:hypothetical protein